MMVGCRECKRGVAQRAKRCPHCGAFMAGVGLEGLKFGVTSLALIVVLLLVVITTIAGC